MRRFASLVGLDAAALRDQLGEAAARGDHDPLELTGEPGGSGGGWLWHGLSLALPAPAFALFGKFGKTFTIDLAHGDIRGLNVRMRQRAGDAWEPARLAGRELTYGRYRLVDAGPDAPYPGALLIDYGRGMNRPWDPLGLVRDYIAEVEPGLWLGHMWLELGAPGPLARLAPPRLVPTPSWFALARGEPRA